MVHRNQHSATSLRLVVSMSVSRAKTTSSFLMFQTTPIVGFITRNIFPMLLFLEVFHRPKRYLLIDGLKLENGILKEVGSSLGWYILFKTSGEWTGVVLLLFLVRFCLFVCLFTSQFLSECDALCPKSIRFSNFHLVVLICYDWLVHLLLRLSLIVLNMYQPFSHHLRQILSVTFIF